MPLLVGARGGNYCLTDHNFGCIRTQVPDHIHQRANQMKAFLVTLLAVVSGAAQADTLRLPALYTVSQPADVTVLQVHLQPDTASDVIGALVAGQTDIEVIDLAENGTWANVNVNEGSGWVQIAGLQPMPDKSWSHLTTPLQCAGTEPFWGLRIDPVTLSGSFRGDSGVDTAMSVSRIWDPDNLMRGYDPESPVVVRFGEQNALAFLTPAQCSDGMSDRNYGINILLSITEPGQDEHIWTGCCLMAP
jgi:uncharacterized membrane protein